MSATENLEFIRSHLLQVGWVAAVLLGLMVLALRFGRRGSVGQVLADILDGGNNQTPAAAWGVRFLVFLTITSVLALILETEPGVYARFGRWLLWIEVFALCIFTLELLLRLWLAPQIQQQPNRWRAMLRYLASPFGLVDLLTVIPGWLYFFPGSEQLALVRILRLLRFFKLGQYGQAISLLDDVIRQKRGLLLVTAGLAFMLLVGVSTLMYLLEGPLQPERMGSIPLALWWGVVTMATIGYGDVVPLTPAGKALSGFMAFVGIGLFALPTAILATGLLEAAQKRSEAGVSQALQALLEAHQEGRLEADSPLWQQAREALEQKPPA